MGGAPTQNGTIGFDPQPVVLSSGHVRRVSAVRCGGGVAGGPLGPPNRRAGAVLPCGRRAPHLRASAKRSKEVARGWYLAVGQHRFGTILANVNSSPILEPILVGMGMFTGDKGV